VAAGLSAPAGSRDSPPRTCLTSVPWHRQLDWSRSGVLALGTDPSALTALLMRRPPGSALVAIVAGFGLAWGVTKAATGFSALAVGVRITDPRTWILAAASEAVTRALAGWWPAQQAARVDPVGVLRQT